METNDLLLLARIARLGTISAAARDLQVSPAAASARLLAPKVRALVDFLAARYGGGSGMPLWDAGWPHGAITA